MASMHEDSKKADRAINDPGALYLLPENVLYDARLTNAEKIKILESWAYDLERLMEAEGENMVQVPGGGISNAVLYQKIKEIIRSIGN
jgi:hypothetical protein